ncbi:MAG: S8 family serine peptidase [Elusimicrobiota bacterium]|nr:MAG: S8 family serine peptidase [Elusimicrobiota bacterium]
MIRMRAAIASTLSLALVLLSPGSSAYHAAAQTMNAAAGASSVSGVSGAVGANLGVNGGVNAIPALSASALSLTPSLAAPSIAPSVMPSAAANAAASQLIPSALKPTAAAASVVPAALTPVKAAASKAASPVQAAAAKTAAAETLKTTLSAPSIESKGAEAQSAQANLAFDGAALKTGLGAAAVNAGSGEKVQAAANLRSSKKDGKDMPDSGDSYDGAGNPAPKDGGIDELGNPRRTGGEGGPDDSSDPDQGGRGGNGGLFGLFGLGMLAGVAPVVAGLTLGGLAMFPMIIFSLILHEIGHARMADKLGDPTSRLQNRASLNPLHWKTHIDPIWTLLVPAATFMLAGFILGGARPVPVEPRYFKNPVKDMAIVALAGPAVNVGLAVAGAFAITGALAAGLGAGVVAALGMFVFLNVMLAIINFIPIPGFDGSHMLRTVLPQKARAVMDDVTQRLGTFGMLAALMVVFWVFGPAIVGFVSSIAGFLIGSAAAVTGVKLASAYLPALAAAGLMLGQLGAGKSAEKAEGRQAAASAPAPGPSGPNGGAASSSGGNGPVDFIVMFGEKKTRLHDSHISSVDVNLPSGVEQYTRLQQAMLAQLETAGLGADALEAYKGTPLATYKRINAATIRVDGASASEFTQRMTELGFTVHANVQRRIITPVPVTPEEMDPAARNAVTMDENVKIVKMDGVHAAAEKLWGKPEMGFWSGLWAKMTKSAPVQPAFGVIDSGAATEHQLLKRVKEVKNMTSGENIDDIGHGTWVHSTVLHMAPWAKNTTHYKTFLNGGATLDDILRSLTQAGNDGNLVISNSWGDDSGDPNGPDAQLVKKLAQEGHIMVFAAGNAGSRPNTIGAPAIVTYKDPATGAIRVIAVAAAGRDKKIASFSSRGPGSPKTSRDPKYKDQRPDATAVGYNIEGAWPAALGDADRVDGDKGPVKAISGTSMSTPGFAGALAMLAMLFGVTEKGEKLDAIVVAVMNTLEKTGQGVNNEGQGFLNVDAAYKALVKLWGEPTGGAADVSRYRSLKKRLGELDSFIGMTGSWKYGVMIDGGEFARAVQERKSVAVTLTAMEKADKTLAYRAAGPIKRLMLNATGAAPKP